VMRGRSAPRTGILKIRQGEDAGFRAVRRPLGRRRKSLKTLEFNHGTSLRYLRQGSAIWQ
jgi:hypothetical protein